MNAFSNPKVALAPNGAVLEGSRGLERALRANEPDHASYVAETLEVATFLVNEQARRIENGEPPLFVPRALVPLAYECEWVARHNWDSYGCDYEWVFSQDGMEDIFLIQRQYDFPDWATDDAAFDERFSMAAATKRTTRDDADGRDALNDAEPKTDEASDEPKKETKRYELRHYFDVWGDAEDGWVVNDSTVVATVRMDADADDDEARAALVAAGFADTERSLAFVVEGAEYGWEFSYEDGMPACALIEEYDATTDGRKESA